MKVRNLSRYRPITIRGVTLGPHEIKDVPKLTLAEVKSSVLRTKLEVVKDKPKKAKPKKEPVVDTKTTDKGEEVEPEEPTTLLKIEEDKTK